jgi:hypothetical protein
MKRLCLLVAFSYAARGAEPAALFEFHNSFWVNLHHFLYEQAIAKSPESSGSQDWKAAIDYYRRQVVTHDLLSSGLAPIIGRLSELESAAVKDSGLDPQLLAALERAAPVYRVRWWPGHSRSNQAWIDGAKPLIAKYGATLASELAAAYQTPWPDRPVRTDVAEYASWAGAYTLIDPTHVTISSANPANQGPAALEVLFHEASHGLVQKLQSALEAELQTQHRLFQHRAFWHGVLFYTAGLLTERLIDGYTQYAVKNGVMERAWPGALPILDRDWKPYLNGQTGLSAAVDRLVTDYGTAN